VRKLLWNLILAVLIVSFCSADVIKVFDNDHEFRAEWDKYANITGYCYITTEQLSTENMTELKLPLRILFSYEKEAMTETVYKEYSFCYVNTNGDGFAMNFTNSRWREHRMYYTKNRDSSAYEGENYRDAIKAWDTLTE
jgi:hypothetical protein